MCCDYYPFTLYLHQATPSSALSSLLRVVGATTVARSTDQSYDQGTGLAQGLGQGRTSAPSSTHPQGGGGKGGGLNHGHNHVGGEWGGYPQSMSDAKDGQLVCVTLSSGT